MASACCSCCGGAAALPSLTAPEPCHRASRLARRTPHAAIGSGRRVPGAFLHGLQSYLLAHQFGSASGSDMWQHLGEASGLPISEWIEPWFSQAG